MNNALRCAWFSLTMTLLLASLHAVAFILIFRIGYIPKILNTIGFAIVFALLAFMSVVFHRKQKLSEIDFDERDNFINKRVLVIVYFLLWGLLLAGCIASWFLMGPEGIVKVYVLCTLLYASFLLTMIVHSSTTIILYGKGGVNHE